MTFSHFVNYYIKVLLHLPLKQGLKLSEDIMLVTQKTGSFTSSIKTRIETGRNDTERYFFGDSSFTSSIKTRIETSFVSIIHTIRMQVLLHLPLKQGLAVSDA